MYINSSDVTKCKNSFLFFMRANIVFNKVFEKIINEKFNDDFFDILFSINISHSLNDYLEKTNQITYNCVQSKQYYINDDFIVFAAYDGEATYLVILIKGIQKDYKS